MEETKNIQNKRGVIFNKNKPSESEFNSLRDTCKQVYGRIFAMTCTVTKQTHIGQTRNSLSAQFNFFKYNAEKGYKQKLYDIIRQYGIETFTISQLGKDIEIPPNTTSTKYLKSFVYRACKESTEAGLKVLNMDLGTEESKKSRLERYRHTISTKTEEQKQKAIKICKKTQQKSGRGRGSIRKRNNGKYEFRYPIPKAEKSRYKCFDTLREAKSEQDRVAPLLHTVVPSHIKVSHVYRLHHPRFVKFYIGKTNQQYLSRRLSEHRKHSKDIENNEFYQAIRSDPWGWDIVPIYTLYNATVEELAAVEQWTIAQQPVDTIWNPPIAPKPFLSKFWRHTLYLSNPKRSLTKKFYVTEHRSKDEAEKEAENYKTKHGGSIRFTERWRGEISIEKRKIGRSRKDELSIVTWLNEKVSQRSALFAKVAQQVIQRSSTLLQSKFRGT